MALNPLPGVSPRALTPAPPTDDSFDLSHIATPVTAMLMPVADVLSDLFQGSDGPTTVIVQANGQKLQYTLSPGQNAIGISGFMNDRSFSATAAPEGDGVQVNGDTPGGAVSEHVSVAAGGTSIAGQVGSVPFQELVNTSPNGAVATVQGRFGADALSETLEPLQNADGYHLTGTLGAHPIDMTVEPIAVGTVQIHGTIGSLMVEEQITPGDLPARRPAAGN